MFPGAPKRKADTQDGPVIRRKITCKSVAMKQYTQVAMEPINLKLGEFTMVKDHSVCRSLDRRKPMYAGKHGEVLA